MSPRASVFPRARQSLDADPELRPGARNAIDTCLRLKPQERITIITDTFTRDIAAALQSEVERVGSESSLFVLEHHARRPLSYMPEIILDDLATVASVDFLPRRPQPGELGARIRDDRRGEQSPHPSRSHGEHQSRRLCSKECAPIFRAVDKLSQRLVEHARQVDRITCKTPHGTEFEAESVAKTQVAQNQRAHYSRQMGQPSRAAKFSRRPMNTNGVFVVDGVVGDYLVRTVW